MRPTVFWLTHQPPVVLSFSLVRSLPPVLLLLLLLGCGEQSDGVAFDMESLYFEPIGYGPRSSLRDTVEVAIRSADVWNVYRDSLNPIAPFDSVDFTQAVVLLAALPTTTSGYAIEFVSVDVADTVVVAEYVVSVPSDDCLTGYAESVPFQAVLARRTELDVRFVRSEEEYRCTFGPRRP